MEVAGTEQHDWLMPTLGLIGVGMVCLTVGYVAKQAQSQDAVKVLPKAIGAVNTMMVQLGA